MSKQSIVRIYTAALLIFDKFILDLSHRGCIWFNRNLSSVNVVNLCFSFACLLSLEFYCCFILHSVGRSASKYCLGIYISSEDPVVDQLWFGDPSLSLSVPLVGVVCHRAPLVAPSTYLSMTPQLSHTGKAVISSLRKSPLRASRCLTVAYKVRLCQVPPPLIASLGHIVRVKSANPLGTLSALCAVKGTVTKQFTYHCGERRCKNLVESKTAVTPCVGCKRVFRRSHARETYFANKHKYRYLFSYD